MSRQTATQKQLITIRQAVIILAIFVLSVFAFKYAQNVLRIRAAQEELASLEQEVAKVEQQQQALDEASINILSPAKVDQSIKDELGWVQPGDQVYVPVPGTAAETEETSDNQRAAPANAAPEDEATPNWKLWLELVTG